MLFGVLDEIMDVARVSGMVRRQRLIYRMTSFDYRKVFGVIGNVSGMTNGFRMFTGGQPTPGKPIGLRGAAPALSGLVGQLKRPYAQEKKKSKEKEKEKRGKWEGRKGLHLPILVGLGLEDDSSSPPSADPLGLS